MHNVTVASECQENFRMSKTTFLDLCDDLRPLLEKKTTKMRHPLSVETRVALTLYYLADEGRYCKIANAFGISRASVPITIRKVCVAISEYLGPVYVEVQELVSNFYSAHGFPQCIGAVDRTHIPIKEPIDNATD